MTKIEKILYAPWLAAKVLWWCRGDDLGEAVLVARFWVSIMWKGKNP